MDYEKKYKEALHKAAIAYKDEDRHIKASLERIFPEIVGSKNNDEGIREWLIEYFNQYKIDGMGDFAVGFKVDSILAWLEKQTDRETIKWNKEDEDMFDKVLHRIEQLDHYWNRATDEKTIEWLKSLRDKIKNINNQALPLGHTASQEEEYEWVDMLTLEAHCCNCALFNGKEGTCADIKLCRAPKDTYRGFYRKKNKI